MSSAPSVTTLGSAQRASFRASPLIDATESDLIPPTGYDLNLSQIGQGPSRPLQIQPNPNAPAFRIPPTPDQRKIWAYFHNQLQNLKLERCDRCHEYDKVFKRVITRPYRCSSCQQKKKQTAAELRDMDPGCIPEELRPYKLTFLEEQLIALVQVNQYVYVRKTGAIATKGLKCVFL